MQATEWEIQNVRGIVYLIYNSVNNKVYIGITINTFQHRYRYGKWWQHVDNSALRIAIKKYGVEKFSVFILERNKSVEELNQLEVEYIQLAHSNNKDFGYNFNSGGTVKIPNEELRKKRRKTIEQFVIDAKKVHIDKYDYNQVNYINNKVKVCIKCKKHNKNFWQSPNSHLREDGCPDCAKEYHEIVSARRRKPFHIFVKQANKIHGHNYEYFSETYLNARQKIKVKHLPCGAIFFQNPASHLKGQGCPHCRHKFVDLSPGIDYNKEIELLKNES